MTLEPGVLALVLLAAVCHASWNALVKAGRDRLVMQCLVISTPGVVSIFALPFVPFPAPESWPFIALSVLIHQIYYAVLLMAYRQGDLSQVYPIARGAAPALVAILAWIFAGEVLSTVEIAGLLIVSGGIISLSRFASFFRPSHRFRKGELISISFALLTALNIGLYSFVDGTGVRLSGSAASYILWLFVLEAVPLAAVTLWLRRHDLKGAFAPNLKNGLAGGLIAGLAYGIVIWAMGQAPMAHVVALRETSVIIAALIGTRLLGEPFGRSRLLAATIVVIGAALLNSGH
ncbi:MAG: EamA family transporter [Pseudomonadota bacterium]